MNLLMPEDLLVPDYQGWNYQNHIFQALVAETRPRTIIEVGTWKGMSAIQLYKAARALSLDFKLICVDTWLGGIEHMEGQPFENLFKTEYNYPNLYKQFLSNMQHMDCMERLQTIPNTSLNAARWLKANKVQADLIYVDGSHESPDVYFDVKNYFDVLKREGIMFGDDINHPPLRSDLDKFCDEQGMCYQIIDNNYWVLRK